MITIKIMSKKERGVEGLANFALRKLGGWCTVVDQWLSGV